MDQSPGEPKPPGVEPPVASAETRSVPSTSPPPPARGSRKGLWLVVALVVVLGALAIMRREPKSQPLVPGSTVDAELTLISSDRNDVACTSPRRVDRYGCDFSDDTTPRKLAEQDTLRPYMTVDRRVYLIPGLFLEPNIARRYQAEPPTVPREQLQRFSARCKLKTGGRLQGFKLRWAPAGKWSEPQDAEVATVVSCEVPPAPAPR